MLGILISIVIILLFHLLQPQLAAALQVALKRQQAVEDAIALRLVSTKTGQQIDTLPQGNIYGLAEESTENSGKTNVVETVEDLSLLAMRLTGHAAAQLPKNSEEKSANLTRNASVASLQASSTGNTTTSAASSCSTKKISQNAIDMLAQLFPQRKRAVLELVLKRCDSDLIKAIDSISSKKLKEIPETIVEQNSPKNTEQHVEAHYTVKSAFKPVYNSQSVVRNSGTYVE